LRQPELQHPIKFQQDQNHSSTHFFFSWITHIVDSEERTCVNPM
jgi:hypothetical protein